MVLPPLENSLQLLYQNTVTLYNIDNKRVKKNPNCMVVVILTTYFNQLWLK